MDERLRLVGDPWPGSQLTSARMLCRVLCSSRYTSSGSHLAGPLAPLPPPPAGTEPAASQGRTSAASTRAW